MSNLKLKRHGDLNQIMALVQLLANGRKDIDEGRVIPAADVFAQLEAMDRADRNEPDDGPPAAGRPLRP
ncbi:hypothetical protein [Achromobacter sp. NFACC18-2]|uniref:hypothetical protein n=1 Tax=Achromobacter sp. NFACC18-2 TaxID=1564112 RepID=UPI000B818DA1|nr:hypothetical protein [Achromobacter sp. NFACC18-2]